MGEARRKQKAGTARLQIPRLMIEQQLERKEQLLGRDSPLAGFFPPYPDFGEMMWASGPREAVIAINFKSMTLIDYGKFQEVYGVIYMDHGTFAVTVRTKQTRAEILSCGRQNGMMWAEASPAADIETGDSGERYRVLIGEISADLAAMSCGVEDKSRTTR